MAEGSYEFWKTVFEGVVRCGRRVEIDMHAKGMDQTMIDVGRGHGPAGQHLAEVLGRAHGPALSSGRHPAVELPRQDRRIKGFFSQQLRLAELPALWLWRPAAPRTGRYGVLHRMWPGTQRLLLWGDPALAAAYGRASSFCGSSGVELFEPLSFKGRKGSGLPGGRDAYADASLRPARDYEKYLYEYRLWGRLLYNPGRAARNLAQVPRQRVWPAAR